MGSGEGSSQYFSCEHLYQVSELFSVCHSYPNPNTDTYEYFDQVFTPFNSGSSFSNRGSHRVSVERVTYDRGRR